MPETKVKKVSVTLLAPHTHQGDDRKKGDKINVTPQQQTWMAKLGLIEGEK